jgi:hypothetical protein
VIKLAGVTVRRVCIPELADRLVHAGQNETASKILAGSSAHQDVDLTATECAEIVAALKTDCPADLIELRVALDNSTQPPTENGARSAIGLMQREPA